MAKVLINKERCKECGLCVTFCTKGCLVIGDEMNSSGYFFCRQDNEEECTGCGVCADMCPDTAIEVYK